MRLARRAAFAALLASAVLAAQQLNGTALDQQIDDAIRKELIPGAVLVIGHNGQVIYHKAYGSRSLLPSREPMTEDTIFDIASLTKVIATTSAMMKLVEDGKVRINDPVTIYLPDFQGGKSAITVRDLMTHFSGLRPDVDLVPPWNGYETGIKLALTDKPASAPGTQFVYSDINFVLLGEIVRRVSGMPLPEFVGRNVFAPLGMTETMFNPPATLRSRIAPTEIENGVPLRGVVHDPTAHYMGGFAGHAGLFSTAADLSKFAEMIRRRRCRRPIGPALRPRRRNGSRPGCRAATGPRPRRSPWSPRARTSRGRPRRHAAVVSARGEGTIRCRC